MYDLIIIGAGPGGVAAGIYAARKKIKVALIAESFGGQSLVSADVQNWIGTKSVSGYDFGKMLEEHLKAYKDDIEIIEGERVNGVEKLDSGFKVKTNAGKALETKAVLVLSGSRRRKLGVPGEKELDGRGLAYCSICDAPLFGGKDVAVIGGGNAGLEAVLDLDPYAKKIYLLEYSDSLKGDPVTQEKIKKNSKVEVWTNIKTTEIFGDKFVEGIKYEDLKTGDKKELKLGGVFVEIGAIPNTEFVKDLVATNKYGEIVVDHKTQRASVEGIWAAGDASDVLYKQNNISAGDAIKAVLNIYDYLSKL
ncbi:MAG: FAD-dependent oxidoreductase [Candidatus Colwellbacteria bacterium]|nr:FAD-dependent oxidoreductase [Candidatus Colwellbacteria bacterium]